jgi:uncharacterized protein DUF1905/bacteriocin resistance YdeI/OmpD-like protein
MKSGTKTFSKSFKATLERLRSNLGWTIVYVPFDLPKTWKMRGRAKVKGEINGFSFRTSLFPVRDGRHFLLVNKRMQQGAGVGLGDVAKIMLEPDTEERVAAVPAKLKRFLGEDRTFRTWFERLNYSTKKWLSDWVTQPKGAASRARRAEQVAEQLFSAMEAERELPPVLKAAFARDPRALQGWQLMSPKYRRGQLIAIFFYRNPESRDRRVAKTVEDAIAFAERKMNARASRG